MIRLVVAALAIVGLVSLFFGGVSAAAVGAGLLVIPLIMLKVFFFVVLLSFIGRGFVRKGGYRGASHRRGPPWAWQQRPSSDEVQRPTREERFEDWHRMAHAKEEVDSWVEDIE